MAAEGRGESFEARADEGFLGVSGAEAGSESATVCGPPVPLGGSVDRGDVNLFPVPEPDEAAVEMERRDETEAV